ncbi:MAG: pentapeptide repeat-containing protein [Capsulimonadales bacterium]|nr:pentapeptide repeat-containing protein [Capsulimonadales bacterium]
MMKNAYPSNPTSPVKNGVLSALFFFALSSSLVTLVLCLGKLVNDSRLYAVSFAFFVTSLALYHRMANPPRPRFSGGYGPEYENAPVVSTSANPTAPPARPTVVPAEPTLAVRPAEPTLAVRRAEPTIAVRREEPTIAVRRAEPTIAVGPQGSNGSNPEEEAARLEQQRESTFMSMAEFTGETVSLSENTIATAPAHPVPFTRERLQPILTAHLAWLERGALPDADGRAVLVRCDFSGLPLRGAVLVRANLTGSVLVGTDLCEANLSGATLCQSDLAEADLRGADLRETDLRESHLCRIDGRGADLRGAELIQAQLAGANLAGADLCEAYLSGADLSGTDLSGAKLDGAYLSGSLLLGADLTGASLEGIDLRRARYDERTRWPARFEPRICGALLMGEATTGGGRLAA